MVESGKIGAMLTVLAKQSGKILGGNRRGKIFATNATWLKRRPHVWRDAVYVNKLDIKIPVIRPVSIGMLTEPIEPFAPTAIEADVYHLKQWAYKWTSYEHPPIEMNTWCAFNRYEWKWYVYRKSGA